MARLDLKMFIRATPEQIWPILADFEAQKVWMVDVHRLEVVSETRSGAGAVIEVTSDLFHLPVVKDVMEVDTWQPPYRYTVVHRGQFSGSGAFELVRTEGGTVFRWWEEFKPPFWLLGELAFQLAVKRHLRRVFTRSMTNVRRLAEAIAAYAPVTSEA